MKTKLGRESKLYLTLRVFFFSMVVVLTVSVAYADDKEGVHRIDLTRTTVTKLDFSQVGFSVVTQTELHKRLYTRAIERLRKAGIYKSDPSKTIATLSLKLNPEPLGKSCPGKVLYEPSLWLTELVIIKRNTELQTWATTWLMTAPPRVTDPMSIEQLENDLDTYLEQFIIAYKMGNPAQK
jgi:hypothetical protein